MACMKLIGAQVQGFRRFEDPVNVRLLESLIAIVGQNEAGKSSFLDSLNELNKGEGIDERDQTRRSDVSTLISATYEIDQEDKDELNDIPQGEKYHSVK